MYENLINSDVSVITFTGANLLEYIGKLENITENNIELSNATIRFALSKMQQGPLGKSAVELKNSVSSSIINKNYIISLSKI